MKKVILLSVFAFTLLSTNYAQPSGTIVSYGGTKESLANLESQGWIVCDGTLYDRTITKFQKLFGAIGTSWGGDGGNKFAVPDLRGQFLRGVSDSSTVDPDAVLRRSSRPDLNSAGNSGNAVGSKQENEIQSHNHDLTNNSAPFAAPASGMGIQSNSGQQVIFIKPSISISPYGGKETRPKNAYVYYIIKL
jgi:microcystin-dependent protein